MILTKIETRRKLMRPEAVTFLSEIMENYLKVKYRINLDHI